jgi:hypothetical protein
MQALTLQECDTWRADHSYPAGPPKRPVDLAHFRRRWMFAIGGEARSQVALALSLSSWLEPPSGLLWLTDWPIYSSTEMSLFLELRHSGHRERTLIEAPGQVFGKGDSKVEQLRLGTALLLMMAFNWEGMLLAAEHPSVVWLGDEVMEIATSDAAAASGIDRLLERLEIRPERSR